MKCKHPPHSGFQFLDKLRTVAILPFSWSWCGDKKWLGKNLDAKNSPTLDISSSIKLLNHFKVDSFSRNSRYWHSIHVQPSTWSVVVLSKKYEKFPFKNAFCDSINFCFKEDDNALIEEEISGREISVGVIKYKNEIISLPPTEIISHNSFFDYDAKYNGESDEITPADITIEEEEEVRKISLDIYKKLNLKGFSRCDFILRNNLFYFLEVNTNPGLTEESILPQQAIAANISLKDLFRSVIDKYEWI